MYEQHFGFSRPLFADAKPQGDAVFRAASAQPLLRELGIALARSDSVAIISGQSGIGKTTIALDSIKEISTRLACACISFAPQSPDELLEQLLTDFSCEPADLSRVERRQLWRQFLSEMAATDTRVCLLVENADRLDSAILAALQELSAADAAHTPGANLVLTTTRAADALLRAPGLTALAQRVRLRKELQALSASETREYLEFKCRYGGRDAAAILAPDAAEALYQLSAGILRVLDGLFESALIAAATEGQTSVTAALVRSLAESQFGMAPLEPAEVMALLESPTQPAPGPAPTGAAAQSDDIPVLTEFVCESGPEQSATDIRRRAVR